jgi:hypothetical protein
MKEEHTFSGLLRKLARDAKAGPEQLALVERCGHHYSEQGVIADDIGLPLHQACQCAGECWADFSAETEPDFGEAAVSVPWIGPDYFEQRLCVIAINQNTYGGLGAHWWVVRGAIEDLENGRSGKRYFHLHTGMYIAALLSGLSTGATPQRDALDAAAAADAWQRCAFVEGVKCAPKADRSKPSARMWDNCPPRYLQAELEVLAPRVLLVAGRDTWDAVHHLLQVEGTSWGDAFWRGVGTLNGEKTEVFFVNHPGFGHWRASLAELLASVSDSTVR